MLRSVLLEFFVRCKLILGLNRGRFFDLAAENQGPVSASMVRLRLQS